MLHVKGGSQDFSKGGGHTESNIIVMAFSPRNIVGCFLKKRLSKGGSQAPQDPPRYALGVDLSLMPVRFEFNGNFKECS